MGPPWKEGEIRLGVDKGTLFQKNKKRVNLSKIQKRIKERNNSLDNFRFDNELS